MIRHGIKLLGAPVAGKKHVVIPKGHFAGAIHPGINFDDRRRTESVEEEFLLAGPHDMHRLADNLGQARGFHGLGVIGLATKPAADERGDDPDLFRRQPNRLGNLVAGAEGILG